LLPAFWLSQKEYQDYLPLILDWPQDGESKLLEMIGIMAQNTEDMNLQQYCCEDFNSRRFIVFQEVGDHSNGC